MLGNNALFLTTSTEVPLVPSQEDAALLTGVRVHNPRDAGVPVTGTLYLRVGSNRFPFDRFLVDPGDTWDDVGLDLVLSAGQSLTVQLDSVPNECAPAAFAWWV